MDKKIVLPREIDDVLINPGMGFTTFQRFNGEFGPDPPDCLDDPVPRYSVAETLQNDRYPDTSLAYFRILWRFIEPEKGRYRWDFLDRILATARRRGQTVMLRIAPTEGLVGGEKTSDAPSWYRRIVGTTETPTKWWLVDHNDPRYTHHFGELIRAFGNRYDGHPDLESVDVAIAGHAGEGMGSELLTDEARESLVSSYRDSFMQTHLIVLARTDEKSVFGSFGDVPAGWRVDCLGDVSVDGGWSHMTDYYPQAINRGMQDAWKRAPVCFEVCWDLEYWKAKEFDIRAIIDQSLKWHITSLNAKSRPIPAVWQPEVRKLLKKMGYRFTLRWFSFPPVVRRNGRCSFSSWWENRGVAPCYRRFPVAFRLKRNGRAVTVTCDADIRTWYPGDIVYDGSFPVPPDIAVGNHELSVGILDKRTDKPVVKLASEGRDPEGWYVLGSISIAA